jgi:hypothetical protein
MGVSIYGMIILCQQIDKDVTQIHDVLFTGILEIVVA